MIVLVDNGSKRAAATWALRNTARLLSSELGEPVIPASLRFSDTVPPEELDGQPAQLLRDVLIERAATSVDAAGAVVVPLFFGPSAGLASAVRQCEEDLAEQRLVLPTIVAPPLVAEELPDDDRVARAMTDLVLQVAAEKNLQEPLKVVLVDHGTPSRKVNAVRNRLVESMRQLLGDRARAVVGASMERRDGDAYDFNEPLLERVWSAAPGFDDGDIIIAMAFLLPGRHAGPEGDVEQILKHALRETPGIRPHVTPLLASQPLVVDVLRQRALDAKAALLGSTRTGVELR